LACLLLTKIGNVGYYILEKLVPKFIFPMHGGDYICNIYREFAENAVKENFETQIISAENLGVRFEFKNGQVKIIE
jgi:hypothetical protein